MNSSPTAPAEQIRLAMARVAGLRQQAQGDDALAQAVASIKRLQSQRFAGTYADLLADARYSAAARFFLDELYGARDYTERDAQFSRIAGALQRIFPHDVVGTAVALAELHAQTEALDLAMAGQWQQMRGPWTSDAQAYIAAWRRVGRPAERQAQLDGVMRIGQELARLTRGRGLRMMLKMMRGPASAAGLGDLQRFLEAGFDTFAALGRASGATEAFLATIAQRETTGLQVMFDATVADAEAWFTHCPPSPGL